MNSLKDLVHKIKEIATEAGDAIMKIYNDENSWEIEYKGDQSPLTLADKTSNEIIVRGLNQLDDVFPVLSEEEKMIDFQIRKSYKYFWLVDPLDGTKEFIKRNGDFTVNIALVESGRPVLGVVQVPVTGEIYWASQGNGAYYQNNNEITQLSASRFTIKDQGLRVVCSRSHINVDTKDFIKTLNRPITVSRGSSLKFLLIASGQAEIYPRLGPTMEWDTGAAQIILEESGGQVIQWDTQTPLRYNKESLLNPYFVAKAQLLST